MARKQSNTVEYFPHFVEHGKTLFILKSRFGNNGYAFWFQLLEVLCSVENHYYDCRGMDEWQYLVARLGIDEQSATEMLNLVAKLHKIDPEMWAHRIIWCENLINNLGEVYKKRGRQLQRPTFLLDNKSITVTDKPISAPTKPNLATEMPQSKVEYSKVKDSKSSSSVPPLLSPPPPDSDGVTTTTISPFDINIFKLYEDEIGPITPEVSDRLKDAEKEYGSEYVTAAIKTASLRNCRTWPYIAATLRNAQKEGNPPGSSKPKPPPGSPHRGKDAPCNTDPDYFVKGKYGHVVQR